MKSIQLAAGREQSLLRRHPWIFSGGIAKEDKGIQEGDKVAVLDVAGQQLAIGHYQRGSIRVRILQLGKEALASDFWQQRIRTAFTLRSKLGLIREDNTAYRLIHGAGDGLPGLIVDIYGLVAVVQCHSIGMFLDRQAIAEAIREVMGNRIQLIYNRSGRTLSDNYQTKEALEGPLWGEALADQVIQENGHRFRIDFQTGQKTGFFLDQRDNRALLAQYAKDKTVLNTFCYTGGFSLYALQAGAARVTSIDVSANAMALTEQNLLLNGPNTLERHQAITADVLKYFREPTSDLYDIVVVDPPAFAKSRNARHRAVQAYKRLNAAAIQRLKPGGLLFTFSCSQVVDRQLFNNTIVAAGLESGRAASVLHLLSQGADHPVNLYHPEGSYLKGLVLYVA